MKLVAPTASRPVPWLLATFLGFYGLFAGGHLYTGDAQTVLATDRSLLAGRGFAIPFDRAYGGSFSADRKFYGQYGLGAVLTGLAPAAAGDALATALPGGAEPTGLLSRLPFSFWNVPFSAGSIVLLFLVVGRLGFRASTGFALAAACGTATMFWPYAARDFTEPQVTFFFLLTYHELLRLEQTRRLECAAFAGAAAGWALLVKVYVVVMAPLFFIESWRRGGRRAAAAFAAPMVLAALAIAWYNAHRFGSPLATGYASEVQNTHIPIWEGIFGLLMSSGKSIFLFSPPLCFAMAGARAFSRRCPGDARFVWLLALLHVAFFGIQQNWDGDWAWGPRYLLPVVPFAMLAAAPLLEKATAPSAWKALVALGLAVQFLGVSIDPNDWVRYLGEQKKQLGDYLPDFPGKLYVPFHQHLWNPDLSPLRGHWFLLRSTLAGSTAETLRLHSTAEEWNDEKGHRLLPFVELPPAGKHAGSLDFWFASLPRLLEPRQAGAVLPPYGLVTLALLCLGIPRVARSWRLARKAETAAGETET